MPTTLLAASGVCRPGHDGIPSGVLGDLSCATWLPDLDSLTAAAHGWRYAAVLAAAVLAVRIGWQWLAQRAARRAAADAVWLEITAPVSVSGAAAVSLWKLLSALLPGHRRWSRPRRLVFEVHAEGDRSRLGVWIPPGITALAVTRAFERAWPGVRCAQALPPKLPSTGVLVGRRLVPSHPSWLPLSDTSGTTADSDPLRAVYDALAAGGRTGGTLLQIVVQAAPSRMYKTARLATRNPAKARHSGTSRAASLVASGLQALLRAVLDLIQPGPARAHHISNPLADPYLAEQARAARTKLAAGPHLALAVRVVAHGPTRGAARTVAMEVCGGFGLVSNTWRHRQWPRPRTAATLRSARLNELLFATAAETAALAGVPEEPTSFGLTSAAARRRTPSRDVWRPDDRPSEESGSTTDAMRSFA